MSTFSRRQVAWALVSGATIARAFALDTNELFPHFVAKTMDGERITSESVKGKVVLIDFWATWCPPCKKDQPIVESLLSEFAKDGLMVLAVNMGEPRRKVKKYLETSPRASKIVLAEDTTLAAICDANVYPIYNLIDREGRLAGVQRGAGGERALRRLLEKAGLESSG
ncbi:MAG TPA: TlpA disulfide reductase family protein [Bryobacteraceae bacterium]|jgi:thiol-disulfide isomerase/thioredoxin|nr:TlpA disulfide reductase family protein [Bryobacteraceae bacterium]